MLQRFLDVENLYVPLTANRYTYSVKYGLFDNQNGISVSSFLINSIAFVELDFGKGLKLMKLAVVIAITTKRILISFKHWDLLDVLYVDNDFNNLHPSNLVWKFPKDGIPGRINGFRSIPGYSRYSINRHGEVYSDMVNRPISPYIDNSGYLMYGVTPDVGKRTICGRHRLLALAFYQYPNSVDNLDVNHKDGIKINNDLENLEWATRKRNCDHAYSNNLRTDNIEVLIKNIFNGEVKKFYSIQEAARKLDVKGGTLRLRLDSSGQKIYPPGVLIKKASDLSDWINVENPISEILKSRIPLPVFIKDLKTGIVTESPNIKSLHDFIDLTPGGINYHLRDKTKVNKVKNYEIWFPDFKQKTLSTFAEM